MGMGWTDWSHVGIGLVAGIGLKKRPVESSVGAGLYVGYQGLSFAKKGDRVGFDIKTFAAGWVAGVIASEVFHAGKVRRTHRKAIGS